MTVPSSTLPLKEDIPQREAGRCQPLKPMLWFRDFHQGKRWAVRRRALNLSSKEPALLYLEESMREFKPKDSGNNASLGSKQL